MAALGPPLARRFVLSAALFAKLGPAGPDPFWLRSLTIAHAASQIAKASRLGHPDEHFSAGLMHDVGRLALAKSGRDGVSPQEAGAAILERWRFPAGVVAAALHAADSPERIEELPLPREAMVVAALNGLLDGGDRRVWAGFLRVAAEGLPAILEPAAKLAQAGAAGIVEP
jgi:HD-like signal output (HDOD) protein